MSDQTESSQIYLSRDQIRNQLISYLKDYLELENVDLTKSSFLSFLINALSTLTSNLLFYETATYKEFFLTQAQLPQSILNLSAFLGYNTTEASYSNANVLLTIPLGFEDSTATFNIPEGFRFYTSSCQFTTFYDTVVKVINNASVKVTISYQNKVYDIPVEIDTTADNNFSFLLPTRQYKIIEQEFQIDSDLQNYQFPEINVPITGQVSSLSITITPPGESLPIPYTEFSSLYLMSSTDYGYVSRKISTGRIIYFGNGLIGKQPDPGSSINILSYITEGEDGNVISSSINTGDRIYISVLSGQTKIVDYVCTNPSPATGGIDEESMDDVRSNSIKNLVSMERFVSEQDYKNANVILPSAPFGSNSLGVLKRSDLKTNEIQMFTTLEYNDEIVPTRNASYLIPIPIDPYIPKFTVIDIDGVSYYTLFDLTLDYINGSASYDYILNSINITPTLNITYTPDYSGIEITTLDISNDLGSALFELNYNGSDSSSSCVMEILEAGTSYNMVNDTINKKFTYSFNPYTTFPQNEVTIFLTYSSISYGQIARYSTRVTFRQSLKEFMMSNLISDSTSVTIYDIPVLEKSYYDGLTDKDNFELVCLQDLIIVSDFQNYRMMTDFVNLKFANTTGSLTNMQYNKVNKLTVIDIIETPPITPTTGDRYIIGSNPTGIFSNYRNEYAQCLDSTSNSWYFSQALTDDIVYISNKGFKYIFTGSEWIIPIYNIPLQIDIEVFKSTSYFGSDTELQNTIKSTLVETYTSRFGINIQLFKSELISTIQNITGVEHCNVLNPKSNIFLNFKLEDLSQEELLIYTPEYVTFSEDDISIIVI